MIVMGICDCRFGMVGMIVVNRQLLIPLPLVIDHLSVLVVGQMWQLTLPVCRIGRCMY